MLSRSLQALDRSNQQLAQLAAAQSEQIRQVLQEKFYHPLITDEDRRRQSSEVGEPADAMTDVTQFSQEEDAAAVAEEGKASNELEKQLEAEFLDIATEHAASRQVPA